VFAVANVSLNCEEWLDLGFQLFFDVLPQEALNADSWLFENALHTIEFSARMTYEKFVVRLRRIVEEACVLWFHDAGGAAVPQDLLNNARALTGHSPKVTILDAMAHKNSDQMTLMLQGNWSDPRMPLKYLRNRKAIPITAMPKIAAALRTDLASEDEADEESSGEGSEEEDGFASVAAIYYVSETAAVKRSERVRDGDFKCHVSSADSAEKLACGRSVGGYAPMGQDKPEAWAMCMQCAERRPELA
jgi:hypothetical protein